MLHGAGRPDMFPCHPAHALGAHAMSVQLLDAWLRDVQTIRRQGNSVPIIAMTANASDRDRDECMSAGMDGFLSKPVLKSRLAEAIVQVISGRGRYQDKIVPLKNLWEQSTLANQSDRDCKKNLPAGMDGVQTTTVQCAAWPSRQRMHPVFAVKTETYCALKCRSLVWSSMQEIISDWRVLLRCEQGEGIELLKQVHEPAEHRALRASYGCCL